MLENDLFSDVAAASCNFRQPLVGCNIISYLMQTWVLLQYHLFRVGNLVLSYQKFLFNFLVRHVGHVCWPCVSYLSVKHGMTE